MASASLTGSLTALTGYLSPSTSLLSSKFVFQSRGDLKSSKIKSSALSNFRTRSSPIINQCNLCSSPFSPEFLNGDSLNPRAFYRQKSFARDRKRSVVVSAELAKWSKGDAPGDYGGPPLDLKIRKSYGGEKVDPITSQETYIWNADWKKKLDAETKELEAQAEQAVAAPKEEDSGFLSLGRALALDSMDVDLSAELSKPSKATLRRQVEEARNAKFGNESSDNKASANEFKWRSYSASKSDEKKWEKQAKLLQKGGLYKDADSLSSAEKLAIERANFAKLKLDLQIYTLLIGFVCIPATYVYYSPEVSASYSLGLIGSVVYIRMLSSSIESLGAQNVQGAVKGAVGQPRLLVPVVLVMFLNRWNTLVVPEYDAILLQMIPMLVGFFTYKASTLIQTFKEILTPLIPEEKEA